MIEKPTVFVLGAGASKPYGFPTGQELLWDVHNQMNIDQLEQAGFKRRHIEAFRKALPMAGRYSVDALLEHRLDFVEVGRTAIAQALLPYEANDVFSVLIDPVSWYKHVLDKMNAPKGHFGENRVSFVTFNYDRSLEHFLFTSLRYSYDLTPEVAAQQIRSIPIIHVHGQLGYLDWQNLGTDTRPKILEDIVPYSATRKVNPGEDMVRILKVAARGIRIISDETGSSGEEQLVKARQVLRESERVVFLGFGYNRTNVKRLGIAELTHKELYGSACGMTARERRAIGAALALNEIGLDSWDALTFLREAVTL